MHMEQSYPNNLFRLCRGKSLFRENSKVICSIQNSLKSVKCLVQLTYFWSLSSYSQIIFQVFCLYKTPILVRKDVQKHLVSLQFFPPFHFHISLDVFKSLPEKGVRARLDKHHQSVCKQACQSGWWWRLLLLLQTYLLIFVQVQKGNTMSGKNPGLESRSPEI